MLCEFVEGEGTGFSGKREMDFPNGRIFFPNDVIEGTKCIFPSRRQDNVKSATRETGFSKVILRSINYWGGNPLFWFEE